MPQACIPCLGSNIKVVIRRGVDTREIALLLDSIADCQNPNSLELCGTSRGKRAPSQYNLFMASCIKSRKEGTPVQEQMKACAAKYRENKDII